MKHVYSDFDRIYSLIYDDEPIPIRVPRPVQAPPKKRIAFDFSSLEQIRSNAAYTMQQLITEEDLDELPSPLAPPPAVLQTQDSQGQEVYDLTPEEKALLCATIKKDGFAKATNGCMLSVLVDSINEKLFDCFGDIVLEEGIIPRVVAEYQEQLREMFL